MMNYYSLGRNVLLGGTVAEYSKLCDSCIRRLQHRTAAEHSKFCDSCTRRLQHHTFAEYSKLCDGCTWRLQHRTQQSVRYRLRQQITALLK